MPRRPRLLLADHPLHIVQRGINREAYFFTYKSRRWRDGGTHGGESASCVEIK